MPISFTVLPSAARTADVSAPEVSNQGQNKGILLVFDVTAVTATPIVTPEIRVKDENGDFNEVILTASFTLTAAGEQSWMIYPDGLDADFDGTRLDNIALPGEWQLKCVHTDADSITYSVRGHYLV